MCTTSMRPMFAHRDRDALSRSDSLAVQMCEHFGMCAISSMFLMRDSCGTAVTASYVLMMWRHV